MRRGLRSLILGSCLVASSMHSQTPDVKKELGLGVAAYEASNFEDAIRYLEHVVSIDPDAILGHFYLGRSYDDWQCSTPNGCDPRWSGRALQEYNRALELDPNHREALKTKAYLLYRLARFDEAEAFYRKAAKLDANDPEALYSIAVLDFRRTYPALMQEKVRLHLAPHRPLIGLAACDQVRGNYLAGVEEGLELLTRTVQLLNDVNADGYLAVFYGLRAQIQCERVAYKRDLLLERQWWNRACVTYHEPERSFPPRWIGGLGPPLPKRGDTCKW